MTIKFIRFHDSCHDRDAQRGIVLWNWIQLALQCYSPHAVHPLMMEA